MTDDIAIRVENLGKMYRISGGPNSVPIRPQPGEASPCSPVNTAAREAGMPAVRPYRNGVARITQVIDLLLGHVASLIPDDKPAAP